MKKLLIALILIPTLVSPALANDFDRYNFSAQPLTPAQGVGLFGFPDGLTFYADYTSQLDAVTSIGSPTATFTASRGASNPATYIDATGKIQTTITSNQPRFTKGFYDTTGFVSRPGILIEAAGTNLLVYSLIDSNFSVSLGNFEYTGAIGAWQRSYAGTGASTNSVSSDSKSYGGKSMSVQVTNAGAADTDIILRSASPFAVTNATTYAVSFFVKCDSVKTFRCDFIDSTDNVTSRGTFNFTTVANTWIRVTNTITASATDGVKLSFFLGNNGTPTVLFESLQVEQNPYATSWIPTAASALTRNAETLTYLTAGNRTAASESLFVKFTPEFSSNSIPSSGQRHLIGMTITDLYRQLYCHADNYTRFYPSNATSLSTGANVFTAGVSYIIATTCISTGNPNASIYIDAGVPVTSDTDWVAPTLSGNTYIGSNQAGNSQLDGIIQKVAIFGRALSSTEVASVTNLINS